MQPNISLQDRIIVALDVYTMAQVRELVTTLSPYVSCFKIGLELITGVGAPQVVEYIHSQGCQVFYDGKFNDIPNTIAHATSEVARLDVKMFTVHASSGQEALQKAAQHKNNSLLFAVTALTALSDQDTLEVFGKSSQQTVLDFARIAQKSGCDGIICSPQELVRLRQYSELENLYRVTPGVRPIWADFGDQTRVMTPSQAILAGADAVVIGRPITQPPESIGTPVDAVQAILAEIQAVL